MQKELKPLSPQEMKFVESLGQGNNNSQAYRDAYGAEGYSPAALKVQACRKAATPHIAAHLAQLRAAGFANACLTRQGRIEDELAFAQRCEDAGNWGAAGLARDRVNKLQGLYVERAEVTVTDQSSLLRDLERLVGQEAASELDKAARH